MIYKQNLHTHSTFCDGKDNVEEMIKHAISIGFEAIGFSGHSYMPFAKEFSMSLEGTEEYKKTVRELAVKYKDKINVFCGIEFEMHSPVDLSGYDYILGAMHYFKINGEYVGFDRSKEVVADVINNYFGGNAMEFAKCYYQEIAKLPEYGKFDIVAHFDLITKNKECADFFDTESKEYQSYALEAVHALSEKTKFFEVNTGAIARGYRTTPYPDPFILKELKKIGCGVVIGSDCHNKNNLNCYFDNALDLIKSCGFNEVYYLTQNGFVPQKI